MDDDFDQQQVLKQNIETAALISDAAHYVGVAADSLSKIAHDAAVTGQVLPFTRAMGVTLRELEQRLAALRKLHRQFQED